MHRPPLWSTAVVAAVAASVVTLVPSGASAESRFWTHPTDEFGDPTGDIRAYSLALDTTRFNASVALGAFDLASAQSSTFNVELDTNGDGVADFNINKADAVTALVYPGPAFSGTDPVNCPSAALTYNATAKSLTFSAAAACIGTPASLRGSYYYSVAEGGDFAPAPNRFSDAVSNQPDASTPTPTQPGPAPGPVPDEAGTKRLAGADRYATAAEIVRDSFPVGPVPVVFVATGEAFADALAGGPAADVLGGPILPVARAGIPAPTRAELARLQPGKIIIHGGSSAVSDAIATELDGFTDGTVTRLAGPNRYATAARVATATFTAPVPQVLVATGAGFADALAGGAVGAATNSPVLLVSRTDLPAETAAALRQLQPRNIAVLGGTSVVSDAVVDALRQFAVGGGVNRLSGADRYATAARLSQVFWPQTSRVVYLATGRNFPDALAGVVAAGRDQAPLLLTEPGCLPAATKREMDRLQPTTVVVLGGTATVSNAAASGTPCPPPPGTACSAGAPLYSHEDSARCFYLAFARNDRAMAANYATPAAASEFLSWRGSGDPGWSWEGCGEPVILQPSSGISCAYYDEFGAEIHGVLIEFGMGRDFRVEDVDTVG